MSKIKAIIDDGCNPELVAGAEFDLPLGMMDTLEPVVVLVYGSMPEKVFGQYMKYAKFVQYPDWTTRMHGGE